MTGPIMRSSFRVLLIAAAFASPLATAAVSFAQETAPLYQAAEEVFDGVLRDIAPEPLLRRGPLRLLWAQWLALPIVAMLGWLIALGLTRVSRILVRPIVNRTVTRWDDAFLKRMRGPVTLAWALIATFFLLPLLDLRPHALDVVHDGMRVAWLVCLFWAIARTVDVFSQVLAATTLGPNVSARRALLPLAVRVAKLLVLALAVVAVLSEAGYSVASLLAGLGIGGLAVALAAQKTFEHWLGAFAIAVDQPFREGDFIKVDALMGTVEQIGMRSTRLRTLDRTVVSIPNGKLAEMQSETFAPRDRFRLALDLRLVYGTTRAQVRDVLSGVERVLREQPKLREDGRSVVLRELGVTAIVIEVIAYFDTADAVEFNEIRQNVLLALMGVVEDADTRLAVPAQRVEVVSELGRASAVSRSSETKELAPRSAG